MSKIVIGPRPTMGCCHLRGTASGSRRRGRYGRHIGVVLAIAAVVGTLAALVTVALTWRMRQKMDDAAAQARRSQEAAQQAHQEAMRQAAELLEHTRKQHKEEMASRRGSLVREQRLARARQMETVSELLADLGEVLDKENERGLRPDGRLGTLNVPTRVPAARSRLEAAVANLVLLGGPFLTESNRVATSSEFVHEDSLRSALYNAQSEITRRAREEVEVGVERGLIDLENE